MNLLESQWFFQMVANQAKTPADRLVAVFKVAASWMSAPGMRETFMREHPGERYGLHTHTQLKTFLTEMAASAKARHPDILANQLVILLQGAITEELRNPEMRALEGAAQAAQAVVSSACGSHRRQRWMHLSGGAVAASILLASLGWQGLLRPYTVPHAPATVMAAYQPAPHGSMPSGINPDTINAVLVLQDEIEKGICPAPQLLALPQGQMTAYMNVINFRVSENPAADRENIRAFLAWFDKVRSSECYMPPSNGHTSVKWVKG